MKKILVVGCLCLVFIIGCESRAKTARIYHAWCKAHKVSEQILSQDEWGLLRDEKLLPGQVDDSAAQTAAAMSAAALGAASANSGGRK
jgi:hypothetical protein